MTVMEHQVHITDPATLTCPLAGCPGHGEFVAWRWHTGKWREVVVCDTCDSRFYSGATRIGVLVERRASPVTA